MLCVVFYAFKGNVVIDLDMNGILSNPSILQVIIAKIAEEVIKRLRNQPRTALVCFSGATIGFQTALESLARLKEEKGWQFKVLCSDCALEILDLEAIKNALGVDTIYSSRNKAPQKELWFDIDGVIIASATINTVAKLAVGICDNEMLTIINHAIMAGKPVTCAIDGACPDNAVRAKLGMGKSPKGYRKMLIGNIQALQSYGIDVVAAEDLHDICLNIASDEVPEEEKSCPVSAPAPAAYTAPVAAPAAQTAPAAAAAPAFAPGPLTRMTLAQRTAPAEVVKPVLEQLEVYADPFKEDPILTKKVISRVDILKVRPSKVVKVSADSIITDYAREAAREFGMVIEIV